MSRGERTPSTAAGSDYISIETPRTAVNPVVINTPVGASATPSDVTYYNVSNPWPPPESIDSGVSSASSSVFTITDNDLNKTNPSGNIAAKKGNGLYSLETVSDGIDSSKTSEDGSKAFTIIENDLYRR